MMTAAKMAVHRNKILSVNLNVGVVMFLKKFLDRNY